MQPSRNQLCHCGSGRRYKHCHGQLDIPAEFIHELEARHLRAVTHKARHGAIRVPIVQPWGDKQVRVAGADIFVGPCGTFNDFLDGYLENCLGHEWWYQQSTTTSAEMHQILEWHRIATKAAPAWCAATAALRRVAYDLFVLRDNAEVREKVLTRLRTRHQFQGARFELAVAAGAVCGGFQVSFYDEDDRSQQWPEFLAKCPHTGVSLAIEAKSRHRNGTLGVGGTRDVEARADVGGLIGRALAKQPREPYVIFVEVNLAWPTIEERPILRNELQRSMQKLEMEPKYRASYPSVGTIYYNDAAPWHLAGKDASAAGGWTAIQFPRHPRDRLDKQTLGRLRNGMGLRLNHPSA